MFDLQSLLRENIRTIKPYSSARDEYTGAEGIFLDANENPTGSVCEGEFNRYPDPLQRELKVRLGEVKGVVPEKIFLGNGSDEGIDLLFRAFCRPGVDNVITMPPTYGMYQVCADINDVEVRTVSLTPDFQIDVEGVLAAVDQNTKAIFVCSPNNPTGNSLADADIERLLKEFNGIVVVDEAYIDFSNEVSFVRRLEEFPNLLVLQTFSKAWGMAALRLGMAFGSEELIAVFNRIKYPYNVNILTQEKGLEALQNVLKKEMMVQDILFEREMLTDALSKLESCEKIYPSDANFILAKFKVDATALYNQLVEHKIIVRNRNSVTLCEGCLRITIGTAEENKALLEAIKELQAVVG